MPSATTVLSTYSIFAASAMLVRTVLSEIQTSHPDHTSKNPGENLVQDWKPSLSPRITTADTKASSSGNALFSGKSVYLISLPSMRVEQLQRSFVPQSGSITELQDRQAGRYNQPTTQLTLSGLLNFIDGLWSSCGDERIIVFTTNHKDRIDPALLRPGRMDMHIHMSYCTPYGFKTLASNYLGVSNHRLFTEIERLITEVEVTPAEIAEELMKSEEADVALEGLIEFLKRAKIAENKSNGEGKEVDEQGTERRDVVESEKNPLKFNGDGGHFPRFTQDSTELQDRQAGRYNQPTTQLTLSGLLNFIDGLWSSCGDERIIVFTTNHKDRIDPALLRPGRMDMHIHMSYCTPYGFKTLASNYLGVSNHRLFTEIERLITEVEVTPAEIAEELMKSEEADVALEGLIAFLKRAKSAENKSNCRGKKVDEQGIERQDVVQSGKVVEAKRQKMSGELEACDFMPCAYSFL
ncbi:hypothetical protein VitviT2T_001420 [Vitis vinifera]|uniref:AAA-ATPase n=1 Tax=Vitis vinifera TaxID=29760 RepID=A0ABY9BFB9_VITVI|nr:hypothetical protein VitviT2T_001420 [Vitis vinifera]